MKTGYIRRKGMTSLLRFDASFHLSEGIQSREAVRRSPYPCITVGDAAERIFHAGRWKRAYVSSPEHGITLLGSADMLKADLSDIKLISRKYTPDMEDKKLKKGWILISFSGTIGNTVFTTRQHAEKLASQHVIRLVPNNILRAGYVYAFLSTRYGYNLLTQGTFGAVIQHIEPHNVANIPIPKAPESFQKEVDDLIQESATLREQATDALDEAHEHIEKLFPTFEVSKIGHINIKEVLSSTGERFEAGYHQSVGKKFDAYIKENFIWRPLSEVAVVTHPDLFKRSYVDNGLMFFGSTELFLATPRSKKYVSKTKTPNIPALTLKEGMILIPRSGTIGDVAYATSQHAQKLASEDVIRLLPNNILRAGYIFAFLSTHIGKSLIQRYIFGSVIQQVEPHLLNEIPIPVLDDEEIAKIDSLANLYKDSLGKAGELELKAISMVEQEIEKWNSPTSKA